jgi:NADP-dependent 3-hydroxy acid dehydrogenase YdfG
MNRSRSDARARLPLAGRLAVVAGAASGIGRASALLMARQGSAVGTGVGFLCEQPTG